MAVDPSLNFLLTGSADSNIHLWSIPDLLSFSQSGEHGRNTSYSSSPMKTKTPMRHSAAITAIKAGHSHVHTNIVVSTSMDNTCKVWNCHNGDLLRTISLTSAPLCLAIDPADRAFYAGYEDGTVQLVRLISPGETQRSLYNLDQSTASTQPLVSDRWAKAEESPALCLTVSYDGTSLLSGHADGTVHTWDVMKGKSGKTLCELNGKVTNLQMLPPTGFPNTPKPQTKLITVTKPKFEGIINAGSYGSNGLVPENYTFTAQFSSSIPASGYGSDLFSSFDKVLCHDSIPPELIEECMAALAAPVRHTANGMTTSGEDGGSMDEVTALKAQVTQLQKAQRIAEETATAATKELNRRQQDDKARRMMKKFRRIRKAEQEAIERRKFMGEAVAEDVEMGGVGAVQGGELSSDTDEMSD